MPEETTKTFQTKATDVVQRQVQELLNMIPELRSVVVVFDWTEMLNEIAIPGLWLSRKGLVDPQESLAASGALIQLQKMAHVQQQVILKLIEVLEKTGMNKQQVLNSIEERLDARKQELDQSRESPAPTAFDGGDGPGRDFGGPSTPAPDTP